MEDLDIDRLLTNAVACVKSLSLASDQFVAAIESMKEASLKCDSDLTQKRALADAEINRRRSEIETLKDQRHKLERELAMLHKQIDHDRRNAEHELEVAQMKIDQARQEIDRIKAEALKLFDRSAA